MKTPWGRFAVGGVSWKAGVGSHKGSVPNPTPRSHLAAVFFRSGFWAGGFCMVDTSPRRSPARSLACFIPMPETDHDLLRAFVTDRCETSFRALVDRHLPVVWSCARRVTNGDRALAEDVAQQVFADLAMKARAIPRGMPLGGWLHRHAFFTATKAVRSESRRRARESIAAATAAMSRSTAHSPPDDDPDALRDRLVPHLDTELAALSPDDRAVLVLRFFEKRSLRSIATLLDIGEDAARKRVHRALDKLRRRLEKRGISLASGAALAALLPQALLTPPAGLAASVATGAVATAAAGTLAGAASVLQTLTTTVAAWFAKLGGSVAVAGAAAGIAVITGGWAWWAHRPADAGRGIHATGTSARRPAPLAGATSEAPDLLPPLRASAFLVPDALVAARLLAPHHELDEEALFDLVADIAGDDDDSLIETNPVIAPQGRVAVVENIREYPYPIEFEYAYASDGHATPSYFVTRNVGTTLRVVGGPADAENRRPVSFEFEHHLAKPTELHWSGNVADPDAEHISAVKMPQFHTVKLAGHVTIAPGQTRLASATHIPPEIDPKSQGAARRLLVFVTLDPEPSR